MYQTMKITGTLVLLLAASYTRGQSLRDADYYATYAFTSITDTTELTYTNPVPFVLIGFGEESVFCASNSHFNDSMRYDYFVSRPALGSYESRADNDAARADYMSRRSAWKKSTVVNYRVRKDFREGTFANSLIFAFPPQHFEESLSLPWQLTADRDTIQGLPCQMATVSYGHRNYRVWFTPAISINDGPYVFSGLPGMIVKVTDDRSWYEFLLTDLTVAPRQVFYNERFINPTSQAVSRKTYVDFQRRRKGSPRLIGVDNDDEERMLKAKKNFLWRFFMLIEDY